MGGAAVAWGSVGGAVVAWGSVGGAVVAWNCLLSGGGVRGGLPSPGAALRARGSITGEYFLSVWFR